MGGTPFKPGSFCRLLLWLALLASIPGEIRVSFIAPHPARGFGGGHFTNNHGRYSCDKS